MSVLFLIAKYTHLRSVSWVTECLNLIALGGGGLDWQNVLATISIWNKTVKKYFFFFAVYVKIPEIYVKA